MISGSPVGRYVVVDMARFDGAAVVDALGRLDGAAVTVLGFARVGALVRTGLEIGGVPVVARQGVVARGSVTVPSRS